MAGEGLHLAWPVCGVAGFCRVEPFTHGLLRMDGWIYVFIYLKIQKIAENAWTWVQGESKSPIGYGEEGGPER